MVRNTLSEVLLSKNNSDEGITFIENGVPDRYISYPEITVEAFHSLAFLQEKGIKPKSELIFQIEDNRTFITMFWACIFGGIIPVPLTVGQKDEHKRKLFKIWNVLKNPFLIANNNHMGKLEEFASQNDFQAIYKEIEERTIDLDSDFESSNKAEIHPSTAQDVAFIQFSSGSTGNPKGVVLTHENLIINTGDITHAAKYTRKDSCLSWMPLTHDMGLIGFHINPLVCGMNQYIMPTGLFVRRPTLWLEKTSEYGVTILSSPNFGYKYLLKNCSWEKTHKWNLSSVRILYNGAEPISEKLAHEFLDKMYNYGLKRSTMCPVYGLAEASLAVSFSSLKEELIYCKVSRDNLKIGDQVRFVTNETEGLTFVNVGKPIRNCKLLIVDAEESKLAEELVGRIMIKGDNVTLGYYNNPTENSKVFTSDGWLDTGDLGFFMGGNLFITGRAKDIIFQNGQNYYPHDLERIAEDVDGVELNKVVFGGLSNNSSKEEEILAFVFHRGTFENFIPISESIKETIGLRTNLTVDKVLPIKQVPRTTSGKLQRFKLLELYRTGYFEKVEEEMTVLSHQRPNLKVINPNGDAEIRLHKIWKELLPGKEIGVNQNFFEVGGNSLKAAEMTMKVRKEFSVEFPLDQLYTIGTIRELAITFKSLPKLDYSSIPNFNSKAKYKPTKAQKRLYYNWKLEKSSLAYNIPVAFKILGELRVDMLERGVQELTRRHDALRMYYNDARELSISINKSIEFLLEIEDLGDVGIETKLRGFVRPFDLNHGPLFRIKLLKVKTKEYILFSDFHHSISDGISVYRFMNELMSFYSGQPLPELPIEFKDFLEWQQLNSIENNVPINHKKFWDGLFESEPDVLKLNTDFSRPPVLKTKGGKIKSNIPRATTLKLKALANEYDCTLHVLLLAIYRLLIFKYTAQEDFVIGLPVHGRLHPDLHQLHGMFVNNLAIRNAVGDQEDLRTLVKKEEQVVKNAFKYQKDSYDQLLNQSDKRRDPSRNLLFDTMFTYHNMGMISSHEKAVNMQRYFFDPGTAKFDISIEIFDEGSDSLEFHIEYASSLFLSQTALNYSKHFKNLISGIVENPDKKIWEYSVLSIEDIKSQLEDFNRNYNDFVFHKPVHKLFENQVRKTPDFLAIKDDSKSITYKELNDYANALAISMHGKGVRCNSKVILLLEKSYEFIASIIATMKIGATYIPIDVELPDERIGYIISDCSAELIITNLELGSRPEDWKRKVPFLNIADFKFSDYQAPTYPDANGELAYVLYTSGTSGKPKGVMVGNRSLTNYVVWASGQYSDNSPSNFSLFTSVSFDLTVTSIFVPLINGGKIVIYNEQSPLEALKRIIAEKKVNIVKLTPSHLGLLLNNEVSIDKSSAITKFVVGGEAFNTSLATRIYNKFQRNIKIYNEYGPTEATVGCMIYEFDPMDATKTVPIGKPIENTNIYLLDGNLKPVPTGVHGELFISGTCLSLGYLQNDLLNSEKFIPNPFRENEKMYRTGDMAKKHHAGYLEYLGRNDSQVKIKGYRIELSEIEKNLLAHKEVLDCVVAVQTQVNGPALLVGYYVTESINQKTTLSYELNNFLAERLPHYMIPAQLRAIENIPLTNNGKVDYVLLNEIGSKTSKNGATKPKGEIEIEFLGIWKKILKIRKLTVMDNFYEMGGDSIKAVQISMLCKEKGYHVTPRDIMIYHSIRQIALRAKSSHDSKQYDQGFLKGNSDFSPIQKWFFRQNFNNPNFYNQSVILSVREDLDLDVLKIAMEALIAHHDGLRLNYNPKENVLFYNEAHINKSVEIKRFSVNTDSISQIGKIRTALNRDFDIRTDLLLNVGAIYVEKNIKWLCIAIHHLIIDGLSWRIFLNDLYDVYESICTGDKIKLPPKTASIGEWAMGLKSFLAKNENDKQKLFWKKLYETEDVLPFDYETNDWQTSNSKKVLGTYGKEQTQFLLKNASKAYGANVPVLMLVALFRSLKDYFGKSSYLIEIENHGRHLIDEDVSRTIGWFTCMHRFFLELEFEGIEDQIKSMTKLYGQIPNKGINSFSNKRNQSTPSTEKIPIRFNYLGEFNKELDNELFSYLEIDAGRNIADSNQMTAILEFNIIVVFDILNLEIIYNQNAHHSDTIRNLINGFFDNLDLVLESIRNRKDIELAPSNFKIDQLDKEELDVLFE